MTLPKAVAKKAIEYKKHLDTQRIAYYRGELDGYCHHGVWVGGCGIDYMCHNCESGYSNYQVALMAAWEDARRDRHAIYDAVWDFILKDQSHLWGITTKAEQKEILTHFTDMLTAIRGNQ